MLWALRAPDRFPAEDAAAAWRQVLLWDEHTWGAADSVSDPDGDNARSQWEFKKNIAEEAERRSKALFDGAIAAPATARTERLALDVCNLVSWQRGGVVILGADLPRPGDKVVDARGNPVPSQRLVSGELAFESAPIPAFGAARYFVEHGPAASPSGMVRVWNTRVRNDWLSFTVDPETGAVRSFQLEVSRPIELANRRSWGGLNRYVYVPGRDPRQAKTGRALSVEVRDSGPLVATILARIEAPGARSLEVRYRLASNSDALEITNVLDKALVREKESVHFAFPFAPDMDRALIDLGWAAIRPDRDQIRGSCRDWFCVQDAAAVSDGRRGAALVSLDAPLVEIGALTDERPVAKGTRTWRKRVGASSTLFSFAMNNSWHTNYKADQEGPVTLRYVVRPYAGGKPEALKRVGMEAARPLIAVDADPVSKVPEGPAIEVEPGDSVVIASLRPAADRKGLVARLYNASNRLGRAELKGRLVDGRAIVPCDEDGNPAGPQLGRALTIPAFGIVTIRIDLR